MNKHTRKTMKRMEKLRLPELQSSFAEIVGEASRSPNRKYLLRRIEETLAAGEGSTLAGEETRRGRVDEVASAPPRSRAHPSTTASVDDSPRGAGEVPPGRGQFSSMSAEQLQALYLEVVGRATASEDKRYLIWKIREARNGRIPIGPRKARANGPLPNMKVLPLRLEADLADKMDEAWRSRGIKNRTQFIRGALSAHLSQLGASELAALFAAAESSGA